MDNTEFNKLTEWLKEEFAKRPEFTEKFYEWLKEKDRKLASDIAKAPLGLEALASVHAAGMAKMRLDIRQKLLPKEFQNG